MATPEHSSVDTLTTLLAATLAELIAAVRETSCDHADQTAPDGERLLTLEQACERLALSETSVKALIRQGRLPAVHPVERALRIRAADVDAYIRSLLPQDHGAQLSNGRLLTNLSGRGRAGTAAGSRRRQRTNKSPLVRA